jgi:hypothetical protein
MYDPRAYSAARQEMAKRVAACVPNLVKTAFAEAGIEVSLDEVEADIQLRGYGAVNVAPLTLIVNVGPGAIARHQATVREELVRRLRDLLLGLRPESAGVVRFEVDLRIVPMCGAIVDLSSGKRVQAWGG